MNPILGIPRELKLCNSNIVYDRRHSVIIISFGYCTPAELKCYRVCVVIEYP